MKNLLKQFAKTTKLNQRGVLHILPVIIIVLLVAIAGTFYMVSSKASQASTPSNTFLIYSAGGKYRSVSVYTYLDQNLKCANKTYSGNSGPTYKFKKKDGKWQPIKVTCYLVNNKGNTDATTYSFRFNKDSKRKFVANLDSEVSKSFSGKCVFLHDYGISRVVDRQGLGKGGCKDGDESDNIVRSDSVIKIDDYQIKNGRKSWSMSIQAKDKEGNWQSLSRQECQGYIDTAFISKDKFVARGSSIKLKYNKQNDTCLIKGSDKLDTEGFAKAQDFKVTIKVNFSGNQYLNPYTHDPFVRDIR